VKLNAMLLYSMSGGRSAGMAQSWSDLIIR